jgi:CRP-like cAMP-binding protein
MTEETFSKGDYFYKQGEPGNDLYILEHGQADVLVDNHTVFTVRPGGLCGEHALIFGRPRNTSAKCTSEHCKVQVLSADDFFKLMKAHPTVKDSTRDICLRREFQKALVFATKKAFPTQKSELWEAFDAADSNRSGRIDLSDVSLMLKNYDNTFTDTNIKEILDSLDLDGSGSVNWEEFKRIFGWDNKKQNMT